MNALIKPADLDNKILHHPDVVRQHKSDVFEYHAAIRATEQAKVVADQAAEAHANRIISDEEYYQANVLRQQEQEKRQASYVVAEKAAALANIDRLMQSPPVAEVVARNEFAFLQELILWSSKGYTLEDNGIVHFGPGFYNVLLSAPAAPIKKASK